MYIVKERDPREGGEGEAHGRGEGPQGTEGGRVGKQIFSSQ